MLILPVGRETEYQFASKNGLRDLSVQADTRRLITARLNKPHTFGDMTAVQSELSPLVLRLVPRCLDSRKESIPYMALGDNNDWTQIEYNFSPVSGDYFVEERECGDDEEEEKVAAGSVMRRLLFVQNQNFIQTECRLLRSSVVETPSMLSKGQKKRLKKKNKANKNNKLETEDPENSGESTNQSAEKLVFDQTYLDSHHRAALVALSLVPQLVTATCSAPPGTSGDDTRRGLLVGLGGGSMAMSLQKHLSQHTPLVVCELDERMVDVATRFFGFVRGHNTTVIIGDGMQYISDCAEKELCRQVKETLSTGTSTLSKDATDNPPYPFAYIFIDVDGKDTTLGLTAPPESFITPQSLQAMHDALAPGGVLLLNVVARGGQDAIDALVLRLKSIFARQKNHEHQEACVFMIKPSDTTVNIILAAVKHDQDSSVDEETQQVESHTNRSTVKMEGASSKKKKANKKKVDGTSSHRSQLVRHWLTSVYGSASIDPLELLELVPKLLPV